MTVKIKVKRIYDQASQDDGCRVFVDRLWARGVTKKAAKIDVWAKELTPSNELRKWFHEDDSRYNEFARRYQKELSARHAEVIAILDSLKIHQVLTLITATKNLENGHVAILKLYLEKVI